MKTLGELRVEWAAAHAAAQEDADARVRIESE